MQCHSIKIAQNLSIYSIKYLFKYLGVVSILSIEIVVVDAPTLLTSTSPTNRPEVHQQFPTPISQDGRSTPQIPSSSTSDDANQQMLPIAVDNCVRTRSGRVSNPVKRLNL